MRNENICKLDKEIHNIESDLISRIEETIRNEMKANQIKRVDFVKMLPKMTIEILDAYGTMTGIFLEDDVLYAEHHYAKPSKLKQTPMAYADWKTLVSLFEILLNDEHIEKYKERGAIEQ